MSDNDKMIMHLSFAIMNVKEVNYILDYYDCDIELILCRAIDLIREAQEDIKNLTSEDYYNGL